MLAHHSASGHTQRGVSFQLLHGWARLSYTQDRYQGLERFTFFFWLYCPLVLWPWKYLISISISLYFSNIGVELHRQAPGEQQGSFKSSSITKFIHPCIGINKSTGAYYGLNTDISSTYDFVGIVTFWFISTHDETLDKILRSLLLSYLFTLSFNKYSLKAPPQTLC